jgi:hypothetical protein
MLSSSVFLVVAFTHFAGALLMHRNSKHERMIESKVVQNKSDSKSDRAHKPFVRNAKQIRKDNCVVVPFHSPHIGHVRDLLRSIERFSIDDEDTPYIVLVASRKNGQDSPQAFWDSSREDMTLPSVDIVSLEELLERHGEAWTDKMNSNPAPSRCTGNVGFSNGRTVQGMKKILGTVHAFRRSGCTAAWVMDAESFAFRSFSFHRIFASWREQRPIWVLNYTNVTPVPEKLTDWQQCHSDLLSKKFGLELPPGDHGRTVTFWPTMLRTRPLNDFWIYDTTFVSDMFQMLKKEHGTFTDAWFSQPVLGEVSYLDTYLLYSVHQGNPYNMSILDLRTLVADAMPSLEEVPVQDLGELKTFAHAPSRMEESVAHFLNKLPIHSFRGGLGDDQMMLHLIKCHNLNWSWCTSNCNRVEVSDTLQEQSC